MFRCDGQPHSPSVTSVRLGDTVLQMEVETGLSSIPKALELDKRLDRPEKIETALRTRVEQAMSNVSKNIAIFDVTSNIRTTADYGMISRRTV